MHLPERISRRTLIFLGSPGEWIRSLLRKNRGKFPPCHVFLHVTEASGSVGHITTKVCRLSPARFSALRLNKTPACPPKQRDIPFTSISMLDRQFDTESDGPYLRIGSEKMKSDKTDKSLFEDPLAGVGYQRTPEM